MFALTLNSLAATVSFYGFTQGAAGSWTWQVPLVVRMVNSLVVLPLLWTAEAADRRHGLSRDWLHGTGIVAISGLGLVDLVSNLVSLNR